MKAKTKILLTSLMSVAFASSLIAGSTYALFTSEAKANIAVTSGTVKVMAAVNEESLKLSSMEETQEGTTWANGGTVSVSEGTLTLDRMTPGDKVEFNIDITNKSNVEVVMRTVVQANDKGLLKGLDVAVDGKLLTGSNLSISSAWKKYAVGKTMEPINVSIELPENAENEYQDKAVDLEFAVEARQGNAKFATENEDGTYSDGEHTYVQVADNFIEVEQTEVEGLFKDEEDNNYVSGETAIQSVVESAESGETVTFTVLQDITLSKRITAKGDLTINGEGNTLTVERTDSTGDRVVDLSNTEEATTITLNNVNLEGPQTGTYNRGISLYNNKDVTVVLDNCSVSTNYYAFNVAGLNENLDIVIKNTDLTGYAAINLWSKSNITLENCTITGINHWEVSEWNDFAVVVFTRNETTDSGGSTVTLKKCTLIADTFGNLEYFFRVNVYDVTLNIEDCTFIYIENGVEKDVTADVKADIENNKSHDHAYDEIDPIPGSKYVMWYEIGNTTFNFK